jgi:preprotein translocase subunit SecE
MPKLSSKKTEEELPQTRRAEATDPKKGTPKALKPKKAELPAKKAPRKPEESGPSFITRARNYVREVAFEVRKVVWPTRKETLGSTAVVLVIVLISGIFLGIVDSILSYLVRVIIG